VRRELIDKKEEGGEGMISLYLEGKKGGREQDRKTT